MKQMKELYQVGRALEKNKSAKERKARGVFYTPLEVVEYMASQVISSLDLVKNPYVKVFDISCGAGFFLLKAFEVLKEGFHRQLDEILAVHPELAGILTTETLGKFIIENNIWGADIDIKAVELAKASLMQAAGCSCKVHVICVDSLLQSKASPQEDEFWHNQFDCIIGNPPYIGHKAVSGEYKKQLYEFYSEVYRDKSDISYCFFQRGMELLKDGGRLSFITSRYFLEGPSAEGLRAYLKGYAVEEVVDFGDSRVFADAGVSVCIITVHKEKSMKAVKVKKLAVKEPAEAMESLNRLKPFLVEQDQLRQEGWLLLKPAALELYHWIAEQGTHELSQLFDSHQGIITGCDKAFILSKEQAQLLQIEKELLKPWIKNSDVDKFYIRTSDKLLIYADSILDPVNSPNAMAFIERYQEKLKQRRECQKGMRDWYKLQWGRDSSLFERERLVYPYKAAANRFAVDRLGAYCSADVYSLILKKQYMESYTLDYLTALLNSKVIEFYYKAMAKKISPTLYDYYPNKVLKIKLKLNEINPSIAEQVKFMNLSQNAEERKCILKAMDREIYKMYELNESQIAMIEKITGE